MQTLRKKTSPCKYRNDPGRFFGDGVQFKAKLIGILEVGEARGDRMCQEALQDLKMAIRAAGEHKQRITIHVTIDGLRLRDEKTGDSLYHHPVHKISFIAQDMTDSRAFGYIFGSPDSGHRFFGIKTDKAASQVVLAMRDLFQVVFELKKKEIELARQQIQSKSIHHHDQHHLSSLSSLKSAAAGGASGQNDLGGGSSTSAATLSMLNTMVSSSTNTPAACRLGFNLDSKGASKEISPESVADLVDLEQELNSLQRGINQMERITPNDGTVSKSSLGGGGNDDPFGDSFTNFPTLPPPEPGRLRSKASTKSVDLPTSTNSATSVLLSPSATHTTQSPIPTVGLSASAPPIQPLDDDDNWLRELDAHNDVFDTSKTIMPGLMGMPPLASSLSSSVPLSTTTRAPLAARESTETPPSHIYETVSCSASAAMPETNEISSTAANNNATINSEGNTIANSPSLTDIFQTSASNMEAAKMDIKSDAFTDLDPLGIGRIRPYVDKKYFFQELKNPPKKVLKDLTAANHHSALTTITTATTTSLLTTATTTTTATTSVSSFSTSASPATAAKSSTLLFSMGGGDHSNMTDDILNIEEFELKTLYPMSSTSQTNCSSIINSLLTTSATALTPTATTSSFMATGTNANATSVYSPHASSLSNAIYNTSTKAASTAATATAATLAQRRGGDSSSLSQTNNNTALICTCPTSSIIVTCTITNASINKLTNQIPNNCGVANLLTHSKSSSIGGSGVITSTAMTSGLLGAGGGILSPKIANAVPTKQATTTASPHLFSQTNSLRFSRYPPPLESLEQSSPGTGDVVMLARDTDPFSPTRKKSDPFEEGGDLFSKLDPFEFEFNNTTEREEDKGKKTITGSSPPKDSGASSSSQDILTTGHLQVSLPPEEGGNAPPQPLSTVRSRPTPSSAMTASLPLSSGAPLPPAALLKQQTVDAVISSISNKKMPHLFGQSSRFPKRDSNNINMRRLQESDSLSETEAAPEPPPRPDSATYIEPPPLPPKKQFNDIVIRPRLGTSPASSSLNRYECVSSKIGSMSRNSPVSNAMDVPPIPLPSRRIGRSDGSYPGPGRPRKPGHTEDDYLAPLGAIITSNTNNANVTSNPDVPPPLLPPPIQSSSRSRTQRQQSFNQATNKTNDIYENKQEILQQQQLQQQQQQKHSVEPTSIVPDITLSQLLTLGIDELSGKLNVPSSKLSTMTLVELTSYLSEFLDQSKPETKPKQEVPQEQQSIFKVNFDQEATFIAKFDDSFGEDFHHHHQSSSSTFEANFAQFDQVNVEPPNQSDLHKSHVPPSADRYAVFREIIDQELQQQKQDVDLIGDVMEDDGGCMPSEEKQFETKFPQMTTDLTMNSAVQQDLLSGDMPEVTGPQPSQIDTKISEVLAQAKDRYAALRDLILVENLFDQPQTHILPSAPETSEIMRPDSKSPFQGFSGFNDDDEDQDLKQLMDQEISLDPSAQQQRLGLVDSRGFLVEPSSSALTVDDDEEEEDERRRIGRKEDKEDLGGLSSADSNEKEQDKDNLPVATYEQLASSNQQLEDIEEKPDQKFEDTPKISITQSQVNTEPNYLSVGSVASSGLSGSKDDLEIDDLMQRAISNLSLDSRERNSPAVAAAAHLLTTSGGGQQHTATTTMTTPQQFNDVSTSPIPLQRSPAPSITTQAKSPSNKSPQQMSPLPSQLTVVSQIIDNATRHIQQDAVSKTSNESWATFDTPQHQPIASSDKRARPSAKPLAKTAGNFLNLPPPPGSTSNCSQNDSALESPCSSDPRDEAWHKHAMGGSSLSLGHNSAVGSTQGQRRYHKKDRQNTSSSSRDLSWDEDQGVVGSTHMLDYPTSKRIPAGPPPQGSHTTERLGYYRRHGRRMNSCDEDYDYEQDVGAVRGRDPCKHKRNLSRSRDNFEMDSPGWYHHHGAPYPHNTWTSQDIEQVRGRSFDRAAYERSTYGPPIYDKRGVGPTMPPPTLSAYDRRSAGGGYDKRSKYYRGEPTNTRSSTVDRMYTLDDFDEMLAATGKIPSHLAGMYEDMKSECYSPQHMLSSHRQRISDYMYERERKSFDRESLESYEGSNLPPRRRRRSYDSGGDPYASCDSRDDYHRDRCGVMTADKSRSLRKSLKSLRVSGDIDYDQDSEKEYHYRDQRTRCDTRSLQRPSQLSTQGGSGSITGMGPANTMNSQSRIRKSSGSSPWDGEEPPMPGQKQSNTSWKRPSSAADNERRVAESRRAGVKGQTPSGSEDDKDRRYRKKRGSRSKDMSTTSGGRYRDGMTMRGGNYDYITCGDLDDDAEDYVDEEEEEEDPGMDEDENSPADEDKFARLEMRRHEMHNRMMDTHVRRRKDVPLPSTQMMPTYRKAGPGPYSRKPLPPSETKHIPQDYSYDDDGEYEQTPTPRSNTSSAVPTTATPNTSTKFSFDVGFESDFNQTSPPPAPAGTASSCNSTPAANASAANTPASKSSFRFSNDFSLGGERADKHNQHPAGSLQQYELENRGISPQTTTTTHNTTPKLRFDDNVKVSQFDDAFEDDFSKATFDTFEESKDQWQESLQRMTKQQLRNSKLQQRQQDLIKKSESINIFAKKVDDPFEDDDFFKTPTSPVQGGEKQENHKTSSNGGNSFHQAQQWNDNSTNFAKFDENM